MNSIKTKTEVAVLALIAILAIPGIAPAQTALTNSGSWFDANNWNAGVPTAASTAAIGFDKAAGIGASGAVADTLYIGTSTGNGQLDIADGDLTVNKLMIGNWDVSGDTTNPGTLNQYGGKLWIMASNEDAFQMANDPGQTAILDISAGGVIWTEVVADVNMNPQIGNQGSATITVSGGGVLDFDNRGGSDARVEFATGGGTVDMNMSGGEWYSQNSTLGGGFDLDMTGGHFQINNSSARAGSKITVDGTGYFRANSLDHYGSLTINGGEVLMGNDLVVYSGGSVAVVGNDHVRVRNGKRLTINSGAAWTVELAEDGITPWEQTDARFPVTLGGDLVIGLMSGVSTTLSSVVLFDTTTNLVGNFESVTWEDGLSGNVVYDRDNGEVRIESVIPEPVSIGLIFVGIGAFCYRRLRMRWKTREA